MKINFVGCFQSTGSGEISDETHIARSLEELGHIIQRVPRDIWREICRGEIKEEWKEHFPLKEVDINIFAKWDKFDGREIEYMKKETGAPCFYWVWDSVDLNIDWHRQMAQAADLYLSGELGRAREFYQHGIRFYYFQFDCVDADIPVIQSIDKIYDVIYLGTYDNQRGRMDILKEINKEIPIIVWGQNYEEWQKQGFNAFPAVYGEGANTIIARSKIVLGTSCDPHLYGYWSNRVGRVLTTGGLLLQQYAPGMESFLHDYVVYYSTPKEAIELIKILLPDFEENVQICFRNSDSCDTDKFTSHDKARDLTILIERYLKEDNGKDWLLP